MAELEVIFSTDSNVSVVNKGTNYPTWLVSGSETTVTTDKSKWYDDAYYFYNKIIDDDIQKLFVQYGNNNEGWATNRFIRQYLEIVSQTVNTDNSIDCQVKVYNNFYKTRRTDYFISGVRVNLHISVNNVEIFGFDGGNTGNELNLTNNEPILINLHIPPETTSTATSMKMTTVYPDGEFINTTATFGFALKNPNKAMYTPMAIRKGGSWKSLDTENKKIKIRKGGSWIDKSLEENATVLEVNKGHNRIRKSNQWKQLPKM